MSKPQQRQSPLYKQRSWSPDSEREEVWLRRKGNYGLGRRRSKSVTDDDLEELKACIELGFGFGPNSPDLDPRLSDALPALGFYCTVNKQYSNSLSRSSSVSSIESDSDSGSTTSMFDPGKTLGATIFQPLDWIGWIGDVFFFLI